MTPPDQLPAIIKPGALRTPMPTDTHLVPALIAAAGEQAGWRYVEFFTANIRNPRTRRAYARACSRFFAWCEDRGLALTTIRPFDVATYIHIYNWLRVSGTAKMPQVDKRVRHQLHAVVPLLNELELQQQSLEFILPGKGPLHAKS